MQKQIKKYAKNDSKHKMPKSGMIMSDKSMKKMMIKQSKYGTMK